MYRADDELNSAILYARCCFNTSTCYTFHSEESKCVCFQVISSHLESCVWHLSHIRHGIVPLSLNFPIQQHSSYSSLPSSATSWETCELYPNPTSTWVFSHWLGTCAQQHFPTHTGQPHVFQLPRHGAVWAWIDTLRSASHRTHISCIFILANEVALGNITGGATHAGIWPGCFWARPWAEISPPAHHPCPCLGLCGFFRTHWCEPLHHFPNEIVDHFQIQIASHCQHLWPRFKFQPFLHGDFMATSESCIHLLHFLVRHQPSLFTVTSESPVITRDGWSWIRTNTLCTSEAWTASGSHHVDIIRCANMFHL